MSLFLRYSQPQLRINNLFPNSVASVPCPIVWTVLFFLFRVFCALAGIMFSVVDSLSSHLLIFYLLCDLRVSVVIFPLQQDEKTPHPSVRSLFAFFSHRRLNRAVIKRLSSSRYTSSPSACPVTTSLSAISSSACAWANSSRSLIVLAKRRSPLTAL